MEIDTNASKIKIIGTSHIAKQSLEEIKKAILENKPDYIAVELDSARAFALLQEQRNKISLSQVRHIGLKGYLFAWLGQYVQQKLGKVVGIAPGSDMKTALELAKKYQVPFALVDQPIQTTLKNFSQSLTWKEKFRFAADLCQGLFSPKKQLKKMGLSNFNLNAVPEKEFLDKMMKQLKSRYPSVYQTLVEDRNKYMVKKLVKLMRDHPGKKILAVVGAGHVEGMKELLLKVDVVK